MGRKSNDDKTTNQQTGNATVGAVYDRVDGDVTINGSTITITPRKAGK